MQFDWQHWRAKLRHTPWVLLALAALGFFCGIGAVTVIIFQVFFGDDSHLKKTAIMARINEETSIFYLDEETRLGSFFDQGHRRYIPIDEVPAHMINAIIASEDKSFYHHHGVDPAAIMLAAAEGFRRGGSTITQQTVKNLLDRRERTFTRKFKEVIAAFQLERMYDKKQILEFYLNQFHVASNGNGIGIAARYFFNKEVHDLDLVEAAFIAGSVKGPSKYNPFIKYTVEARERAHIDANDRKNYVLRRMLEQGWITEAEFKEAWDMQVPFNRGKFRTSEVALVSLIRGQLKRKEILEAVNLESDEDLNNAGLRIFTTLDATFQEKMQLAMRRNLSRLETILQPFKPEDPALFTVLRDLEVNQYYFAKVLKVNATDKNPSVEVDFGLPKGVVPADALVRFAKQMDIGNLIGYQQNLKNFLKTIKVDDVLFVEVREYDPVKHHAVVELQRRPIVSGGMIAIDKGEVRAVVSGFDTMGYNRAISAARQPGSVFKSVVYYAALQLGWSMLDQLDNERRVFPYQGRFYYPRPDHPSPYRSVSMIFAGTLSENLASIYLTSSLVEKLNLDQFKALMGALDLLPHDGESPRDFHYRVAKKTGVQLDNQGVREFELNSAIADLAPDLVFSGKDYLLGKLNKMWFGKGYEAELQTLYATNEEELSEREIALRIELIKNNFVRHGALAQALNEDWGTIEKVVSEKGADAVFADPVLQPFFARFRVMPSRGNKPALGYFKVMQGEEPRQVKNKAVMAATAGGRALNALDVQSIWGGSSIFGSRANIAVGDVLLEGYLPQAYYRKIENNLAERYDAVMSIQDTYDLPRYFHHHDFRVAVGLNYLVELCRQMGTYSKIEPVLSFPLGANVVTLGEVAKIYQTFIEGKTYKFYKEGPENQLNFIRRIEDRFGNVLYEPERIEHQLVRPEYSLQMQQILRKVVTHGTGRRARGELYINYGGGQGAPTPIRIPAFGKTGTTNDYTTASFAGFVPYPVSKNAPLDPGNSYVLASYVGYDRNLAMQRGGVRISGGVGALPAWTEFAKSAIEGKQYTENLDALDIKVLQRQEWPLKFPSNSSSIAIDLPRGVVLRQADQNESEIFATTDINRSGETGESEFALSSSVRTTVRIPTDTHLGGMTPLRLFSPFAPVPKPGEAGGTITPSRVENAASAGGNPAGAVTAPPSKPLLSPGSMPIDDDDELPPIPKPQPPPAQMPAPQSPEQESGPMTEEQLW